VDNRFDLLAKAAAGGIAWREALREIVGANFAPGGENGSAFDELAKRLAQGLSRREMLRQAGGVFFGTILVSIGLAKPGSAIPGDLQECSSQQVINCYQAQAKSHLGKMALCVDSFLPDGVGTASCVTKSLDALAAAATLCISRPFPVALVCIQFEALKAAGDILLHCIAAELIKLGLKVPAAISSGICVVGEMQPFRWAGLAAS